VSFHGDVRETREIGGLVELGRNVPGLVVVDQGKRSSNHSVARAFVEVLLGRCAELRSVGRARLSGVARKLLSGKVGAVPSTSRVADSGEHGVGHVGRFL
jgi:hypothetical protein